MKRLTILVCIFIGFVSAAQGTLRVTTIEYPPFYQESTDRQGIACDLLREILKVENMAVEFVFTPPMRMLNEINQNITLSGSGRNLLLKNHDIAVSDSLYDVQLVCIYDSRKYPDGVNFKDLSDLSGFTIGVLEKSVTEAHLASFPGLRIVSNMSNTGLAKQLATGRIDLWATVDIAGFMTLADLFPTDHRYFASTKAFQRSEINVIVPLQINTNKNYIQLINQGLATIKKNGTYRKIIDEYLVDSVVHLPIAVFLSE